MAIVTLFVGCFDAACCIIKEVLTISANTVVHAVYSEWPRGVLRSRKHGRNNLMGNWMISLSPERTEKWFSLSSHRQSAYLVIFVALSLMQLIRMPIDTFCIAQTTPNSTTERIICSSTRSILVYTLHCRQLSDKHPSRGCLNCDYSNQSTSVIIEIYVPHLLSFD